MHGRFAAGKRLVGLRVIDRAGGPMQPPRSWRQPDARDRDVLRFGVLLFSGRFRHRGWIGPVSGSVWMLLFAALPFIIAIACAAAISSAGPRHLVAEAGAVGSDLVSAEAKFFFTMRSCELTARSSCQVLEECCGRQVTPNQCGCWPKCGDKICRGSMDDADRARRYPAVPREFYLPSAPSSNMSSCSERRAGQDAAGGTRRLAPAPPGAFRSVEQPKRSARLSRLLGHAQIVIETATAVAK